MKGVALKPGINPIVCFLGDWIRNVIIYCFLGIEEILIFD